MPRIWVKKTLQCILCGSEHGVTRSNIPAWYRKPQFWRSGIITILACWASCWQRRSTYWCVCWRARTRTWPHQRPALSSPPHSVTHANRRCKVRAQETVKRDGHAAQDCGTCHFTCAQSVSPKRARKHDPVKQQHATADDSAGAPHPRHLLQQLVAKNCPNRGVGLQTTDRGPASACWPLQGLWACAAARARKGKICRNKEVKGTRFRAGCAGETRKTWTFAVNSWCSYCHV